MTGTAVRNSYAKASQSSGVYRRRKRVQFVFADGMYVGKNTSQPASARGRLQAHPNACIWVKRLSDILPGTPGEGSLRPNRVWPTLLRFYMLGGSALCGVRLGGFAPKTPTTLWKGWTQTFFALRAHDRKTVLRPRSKRFCPSRQDLPLTFSPEKSPPSPLFSKNSYISKIPRFFSAFSLAKWKGPC